MPDDYESDSTDPRRTLRTMAKEPGFQLTRSAAERYERTAAPIMAPFVSALLAASRVRTGSAVLVVACGTGFAARAATERVGPMGRVVGLDVNPAMLEVATVHGAGNAIEWVEGSAEALPFPRETFDAVVLQQGPQFVTDVRQGLQFVTDLQQAVHEAARVVRADGCVAATVWLPVARSPYFDACHRALQSIAGEGALAPLHRQFGCDPEQVRRAFRSAGLHDIEVDDIVVDISLPDAVDFIPAQLSAVPWGAALSDVVPDARDRAARAILMELVDLIDADGTLTAPFAAALVSGNP